MTQKLKDYFRKLLILCIGTQFYIIVGTKHSLFGISLVMTIFSIFALTIIIIFEMGSIIDFLKKQSLWTLLFINTTLLIICFLIKKSIYEDLLKDGVRQLNNQINDE